MKETSIKQIPLENLYHNPNNPRQEIGDVTELAESIRVMGILQNMSVVPFDPKIHVGLQVTDPANAYVVLIGNRRLEGAKLAGIATAPCIVLDLDAGNQMGVMLVENLQRQNLTPFEEAIGFRQLTFDLGKSVEEVAKMTGFSVSTVRNRIKLTELDPSKLAEADKRGGTLTDYMALSKIKDLDVRNEVLGSIGTRNFNNALRSALDKQKAQKALQQRRKDIAAFAKKVTQKGDTMVQVACYYSFNERSVDKPDDADTVSYFYREENGNLYLYRERTAEELSTADAQGKLAEQLKQDTEELRQIHKRMKALRYDFISKITPTKAKKLFPEIAEYVMEKVLLNITDGRYCKIEPTFFASGFHDFLELEVDEESSYDLDELNAAVRNSPEYAMLVLAYLLAEKRAGTYFSSVWDHQLRACPPRYEVNEDLDNLYFFLQDMGYQLSDEEDQITNGTHRLFYVSPDEAPVAGQTVSDT